MLARRDKVKVTVSLLVIAVSAFLVGVRFFPEGCGPSEEERQLLQTLNSLDEIAQRGGHVTAVTRVEDDRWHERRRPEEGGENRPALEERERRDGPGRQDSVYRFEAEIYNADGVAIGRLRGGRVENFGTMTPRIQWYKTPGVPEEWTLPPRWGRDGRDGGPGGPRGGGDRERRPRGDRPEDMP